MKTILISSLYKPIKSLTNAKFRLNLTYYNFYKVSVYSIQEFVFSRISKSKVGGGRDT